MDLGSRALSTAATSLSDDPCSRLASLLDRGADIKAIELKLPYMTNPVLYDHCIRVHAACRDVFAEYKEREMLQTCRSRKFSA